MCRLLKSPQRLEQEHQQRLAVGRSPEDLRILEAQLGKLQRGTERLIDSYSEGVIDKEQFMPRLSRTKSRIRRSLKREFTQTLRALIADKDYGFL